jgi:selenocysteine-specific translation elongation factor
MTNVLIAAVVALLLLFGVQTVRLAKEQAAHQKTIADHAVDIGDQARLFSKSIEAVRAKEVARVIALEGVINANTEKLAATQADAAAARVAADRLRDKIARITAAASERSANPGASPASSAADDTTLVLADLLRRADERAGELAEFADRAHQAGQVCEASYYAVKAPE